MTPDNHYNTTLYHYYLARSCLAEGDYDRAVQECSSIRKMTYDATIKKRLDKVLGEVKSIQKDAVEQTSNK